ncbi:MAG: hypothetical protein WCC90_10950 [Methylocella sp.]
MNSGCGAAGPLASPATLPLPDVLRVADNADEGLRIAAGAEHANEALLLGAGRLAKLLEADRHLDVVAQDRLAGAEIAGEHGVDPFAQQRFAEGGIACDRLLHQLLETPRVSAISCLRVEVIA